ncbi:hypothetical protein [Caldimonas tepidiphila]|nr:hypothetical protein [Caldimonas tepidiphila]
MDSWLIFLGLVFLVVLRVWLGYAFTKAFGDQSDRFRSLLSRARDRGY